MSRVSPARAVVAALLATTFLLGLGAFLSACGSADPGSSSASGSGSGSLPTTAAASDSPFAPAFSGVTLDGKTVSLAQFRGKPLLLVYMTST
jgi:hypothetical protein